MQFGLFFNNKIIKWGFFCYNETESCREQLQMRPRVISLF
nr:MAG TPA: hypothetical protein [Caudoviricetes sp.]